jgi:hypothetical protein
MHVNKESKIYVACPANVATGGPELLHQLVYKLNKFGINAYMYYYYTIKGVNPVHPEYRIYNNEYVDYIDDNSNNIIIVPEVKTELINKYKNIQKVIWWLSVDNYVKSVTPQNIRDKIKRLIKLVLFNIKPYKFDDNNVYHLVQSEYARQFLLSNGIEENKIAYLSDYINPLFIQNARNSQIPKENIVAYNPKKGYEFTKKIIKNNKYSFKFVPIVNMTRQQVAELLLRSKVYIDFRNHPGKDRIPREAAICNCCVIVGKRGSAKYHEDVPISEEFKFDIDECYINDILDKINDCMINYDDNIRKFEEYRKFILSEESRFEQDIRKIFKINDSVNL